jgi:hypothetical protein
VQIFDFELQKCTTDEQRISLIRVRMDAANATKDLGNT